MSSNPPTEESRGGVSPLLVMSPRDGTPAGHTSAIEVSGQDTRRATLRRSEFGWDCRLDGAYVPTDYDEGRSPRITRSSLLAVFIALVAAGVALVAIQPGAAGAPGALLGKIGSFFHHDQPTAANGDTPPVPTDSGAADASPSADPTDTPAASTTPAPTSAPTASPPPDQGGGAGGPGPTASAPPPSVVHLSGQYTVGGGGNTSTSCDSGRTSPAACSWSVSIEPNNALYATLAWTGGATMTMRITLPDGHVVYNSSSNGGTLAANFATPPAQLLITVTISSPSTTSFDLNLANHA